MGNCLVLQTSMVRIMKPNGKILEYRKPIKVHEILKHFSNHAISHSQSVIKHLHPNTKLINGQLYYLISLPVLPSSKASKKKVSFAEAAAEVEEGAHENDGVIRIKLVISKQELQHMVKNGGICVNEMLSLVHGDDFCRKNGDGSQGWKPVLESIPEVN